jgi:hypothetical protein
LLLAIVIEALPLALYSETRPQIRVLRPGSA